MMSVDAMQKIVDELIARGYSAAVAEDYASRLGDTIEEDASGKWIIRGDNGEVIDRIDPLDEE